MQQKSCGDYLDDLHREPQVMLQKVLWQSEMFVWVTVLNMWFHNGKKWQWTCSGQEHLSDKVFGPYTYGSYNTKHALFQHIHQIHCPNKKLRNGTEFHPIPTDYQTTSSNVPPTNADTQSYFHEDKWSWYPGHLFVYNYLVNIHG